MGHSSLLLPDLLPDLVDLVAAGAEANLRELPPELAICTIAGTAALAAGLEAAVQR